MDFTPTPSGGSSDGNDNPYLKDQKVKEEP